MLQSLTIENVVVVDFVHIDFSTGFSVFTGETGAGKSILLDALSLVLGDRAQTHLIREGKETASVSAHFHGLPEKSMPFA
ncbi:MAG: AAA family ATPase [Holosporaceae bacterium]|nr:MAG: AAA family ATPase [Holosporaceae bacterium]